MPLGVDRLQDHGHNSQLVIDNVVNACELYTKFIVSKLQMVGYLIYIAVTWD